MATKITHRANLGPKQPLLSVSGVTLQYKTRDHQVTATYRVGFDVYPSERYVILGPSGCGKSTLLKAIGGYLTPTEGTIRLAGSVVRQPGADRMMVFQEFDQLLPWKTVKGNVMFPLLSSGTLRSASIWVVISSTSINGCIASGKRSDEKKMPDTTHMGSITGFISPETASTVRARLATSSPMPAKASAPKRISILLRYDAETLTMRVEDDGCGFDVQERPESALHFGLIGMRERTERIGGQLSIQSTPGAGSVIKVVLRNTDSLSRFN